MDDVYENINDYNPIRKRKKLIVFDDIIAYIMGNKKIQGIIKELFIRCSYYFTYFYYSILSFCSKRSKIKYNTLFHHENKQQKRITKYCNQSFCRYWLSRFKKIYRECRKEPFNFLTIDTTLPASDPLRFRKNLSDSYVRV